MNRTERMKHYVSGMTAGWTTIDSNSLPGLHLASEFCWWSTPVIRPPRPERSPPKRRSFKPRILRTNNASCSLARIGEEVPRAIADIESARGAIEKEAPKMDERLKMLRETLQKAERPKAAARSNGQLRIADGTGDFGVSLTFPIIRPAQWRAYRMSYRSTSRGITTNFRVCREQRV